MNWQSGVSYIYFICWLSKSTSDASLSKKKEKRTGCGWLFSLFCGLPLEGCSHWEPYLADIPDSSAVKCSDAKELGSSGDSHPRLTGDFLLILLCQLPIIQWEQKPRNINTDQEWQNLSNSKVSLSSLPFTAPLKAKEENSSLISIMLENILYAFYNSLNFWFISEFWSSQLTMNLLSMVLITHPWILWLCVSILKLILQSTLPIKRWL